MQKSPGKSDNLRTDLQKTAAATPGQQDLYNRLVQLGIISAGVGGVYGAGKSLHKLLMPPTTPALGSGSNVPTQLPVVDSKQLATINQQEDDADQLKLAAMKLAEGGGIADSIASRLPEPDNTNPLTGNAIPYTAAAAIAPAAIAYKGINALYDKYRKSQQQRAVQQARKEYEQALAAQYRSVMGKRASANDDAVQPDATAVTEVMQAIDTLYVKCAEKDKLDSFMGWLPVLNPKNIWGSGLSASVPSLGNTSQEGFNSLRGITKALALASGVGAGTYMYNRSKKLTPEEIMQEALKQRSRNRRAVPNVLTPQLMATAE